jgi:membrane associated rhomboid family serine protease
MFPLRDINPSRHAPVMTLLILVANLAVFFLELSLPRHELAAVIDTYGIVPARVLGDGLAGGQAGVGPLSLLTSMFLHAGWLHLIFNLWILWIFGDNVEDRMGAGRYLVFYLGTGLSAGLVHLLTNPGSTLPTVGASGAIAGVMGAYFVLFPTARVLTVVPVFFWPIFLEVPAVVFMIIWFAGQLFSGLFAAGSGGGGIAWWAHVGGFVAGVVLCPLLVRRRRR